MPVAKLRLLICFVCKSIEEVPYYEGPPERDDTLNFRTSQHQFASGERHVGQLAVLNEDDWKNPQTRSAIIKQISEEFGEGLGQEFYDVKATFEEDAMKCWNAHSRTLNCGDYKTDERKRLLPDTREERKDLGLSVKNRPNTWLCDFCPYKSVVQGRVVKERGLDA